MSKKLIKLRKQKGLTQKELAKILNVSISTYKRYETGERVPNVYVAQHIASILNTTVDTLFPKNQLNK